MGPFMVEIVFCRVTRRGRKKRAGMNKAGRDNMRNDGPAQSFIPKDDFVKVTLDLSDNGPVFGALDDMMTRLSLEGADDKKGGKGSGDAKKALKNLLKSGIPGIEGMFGPNDGGQKGFGKKSGKKGFHKMTDQSKKKFMTAIFGEDGTQIDTATAAALLAATCSGGNPEIGNKLAELLVPNMGSTVDPIMMGALMSACSLINAGAGTEEVMKAMMLELANSGMTEEEILEKTQLLMKCFGKEEAGSTAEYKLLSKQKNKALTKLEIPPKDFTAIILAHKAIAACGTTPENIAKLLMIQSTLGKKSANPMHVAAAMKNLGQISEDTKAACIQSILKAWGDNPGKITKLDVGNPVRMHMGLDNENEPGWTEVKNLKDIVGGVSPNSQEAIELNLARGVKAAGLKKDDIGRGNLVLKVITALGVDLQQFAKILFLEKTICQNGVPSVEVGRVLSDGLMPQEATQGLIDEAKEQLAADFKPADCETAVKLYNNLKIKSNNPLEVIEYVDKTLIQVRCSLEDVADNMFSQMSARGEKEMKIVRDVTETLKKTGASASVVGATIMPPLKDMTGKTEVDLTKVIGRNLKDVDYDNEDVKSAMTEMIVKIIEEDPQQHQQAVDALSSVFKDLGESPFAIKDFVAGNLPPPPTPPEEVERRRQMAEELERLEREEQERNRPKDADDVVNKNLKVNGATDSRRGSLNIGGTERRGSYYDANVTTRASVAVVTDDPDNKKKVKQSLSQVFGEDGQAINGFPNGLPEDEESLKKMLADGNLSEQDKMKLLSEYKSSVSPETRELMAKILASNSSQDEISSRVAALLAGTALSTSKGGDLPTRTYGEVEPTVYDIGDTNVSSKKKEDTFQMPEIPGPLPAIPTDGQDSGSSRRVRRPSIKRQSEILREARKSRQEEMEEERKRKASYFRRVTGLRKAKVPLMVYSCGGFSRCFRIARFYDPEGPPVGLYYDRPGEEERDQLNPDL